MTKPTKKSRNKTKIETATFAGGCFWCMQPCFDSLEGIVETVVGYTGGTVDSPDYEEVSSGKTGHAEAIEIHFDPEKISYNKLLELFWLNIDPTTKDQQFSDQGTQYRTAIFYHNEEQKKAAEESSENIRKKYRLGKIATEILPAGPFYTAEEHHQKYYQKHPFRYSVYHAGCGRVQRLKQLYG